MYYLLGAVQPPCSVQWPWHCTFSSLDVLTEVFSLVSHVLHKHKRWEIISSCFNDLDSVSLLVCVWVRLNETTGRKITKERVVFCCRSGSGAGCRSGSGAGCRSGSGAGCRPGSGAGCRPGSGAGCRSGSGAGCRPGSGAGCRITFFNIVRSNVCFDVFTHLAESNESMKGFILITFMSGPQWFCFSVISLIQRSWTANQTL